jgi:hypothetical protein
MPTQGDIARSADGEVKALLATVCSAVGLRPCRISTIIGFLGNALNLPAIRDVSHRFLDTTRS